MDRAELVAFVRLRGHAVLASRGPDGAAQPTRVRVAITDDAEIIFDASVHSREYQNIRAFCLVALAVGGDEPVTLQCEGEADLLAGAERDRCLRVYFQQHPGRRELNSPPYLVYLRVRPRSLRLSDSRRESFGVTDLVLPE